MPDLSRSTLHAVVSPSVRLRDELLRTVLDGWQGPVTRLIEPDDVDRLVIGLDTESLFDSPAAVVVRCDDRWLKKHAGVLLPIAGRPVAAGIMVLMAADLEAAETKGAKGKAGGKGLTAALSAAGGLHVAAVPDGRAIAGWLTGRIGELGRPVDAAGAVAQALVAHIGEDPDALLAALEVADLYAGDEPLTNAAVDAVVGGLAAKPAWDFAGFAVEGKADRAYAVLAGGGGLDAQPAVAAVLAELRKQLATCDSADNAEAAAWAGVRNPNAMHFARRKAQAVGRGAVLRLLRAAHHAQDQLRRSGSDHRFVVELLVQHARSIVKPAR
jgi:hypothetical protein